ncbi:MAG: hypothetical protein JWM23_557 [Microbacteriaceae bacterium]|nr:hypothetical protein [Microbacteriaceae bacterium]
MARNGTFDALRPRARELYDEGHGCNAIAKQLGVAPSTISRWAKEEDLAFDRSQTSLAVRAHAIDMAESRMLLTQKMLVAGHEALDSLDEPFTVYSFGGAENVFSSHTFDSAPIDARKTAVMIAKEGVMAAAKALEKSTDGLDAAMNLVDRILDKFEQSVPPAPDGD